MRLRFRQAVMCSTTSAEERDLGNRELDIIVDTLSEGGVMRFKLVAGVLNQNLQHPQVATAAYLFVCTAPVDPNATPGTINLRRNSPSGEEWPVAPVDGKEGCFQMSTSGLTALYASNPGTVDMFVTVGMAGD